MDTEYADDVIVLDLRRWRGKPFDRAPFDSWTAHASPLEHWYLATSRCRDADRSAPDRAECQVAEWDAHLLICPNCASQVARVELDEFAADLPDWREAAG